MLDLLIVTVLFGTFAGGFWCGKTYHTPSALFDAAKNAIVR